MSALLASLEPIEEDFDFDEDAPPRDITIFDDFEVDDEPDTIPPPRLDQRPA